MGHYTIDAELGSGGMGSVHRATGPDGTVALKVVHPHLRATAGFFTRFLREAEIPVTEDRANFVLYVSNQGPAIPVVDIPVWIDGRLATRGQYEVGDRHDFEVLHFRFATGLHTIRALSNRGHASLEQDFELPAKRWAGLDVRAPTPGGGAGPATRFLFSVSEEETFIE